MTRRLDLTNQTFGYIRVLEQTDRRDGSNIVYRCLCSACGKECYMSTRSLRSAGSKSCGCMRPSYLGKYLGAIVDNAGIGETNRSRIVSNRPQKNNKSGVRGVCWTGGQWEATLWYRGRRMRLYRGPDFDAAVQARKDGEAWRLTAEGLDN